MAMRCAVEDRDNPLAEQDLEKAIQTAEYLDKHQWGHSLEESLWLRGTNLKVSFLRWQKKLRDRLRRENATGRYRTENKNKLDN
jgi:hypothetical protein